MLEMTLTTLNGLPAFLAYFVVAAALRVLRNPEGVERHAMLAAEAGASPNTLAAYRNDLDKAAAALTELGRTTQPSVTITMYEDFPAGKFAQCSIWSGDIVNAANKQ